MRRPVAFAVLLVSFAWLAKAPSSWGDSALESARTVETRIAHSPARSVTDTALEEHLASDWGLQTDEWARYRELMRGPLGIYSPTLDPLTALGIEARSENERQHYAQLQVQFEGRRVEKMLAYQRAYDGAWRRLHPTLQPLSVTALATAARTSGDAMSDPGRLAVFVKDPCPECDARVKQLQAAGRAFDVFMVGSRQDDGRIRQWAARVGIDPIKVHARIITLNHDAGRWLSIGGQGELPAVGTQVNGQWRRE